MVSSPGVELGRPEQTHVGLVGTTGGADVEVTASKKSEEFIFKIDDVKKLLNCATLNLCDYAL
jgi:hypothetical protein